MKKILLVVGFLGLPGIAYGQVVITEIMYNLEAGSDTGREWVEIQNTSSGDIDFSLWRFAEGETNHKVVMVQGNAQLPPGGYAILVEKFESFKADWPQFSGTVFDSSFSLSNTGELLAVRDADLKDVDSVLYSTDAGGAGDGRSLQKVGGTWVAGMPTPGAANAASSAPSPVSSPTPVTPSPVSGSSPTSPPSSSGGTTGSPAPSAPLPLRKSIRAVIDTSTTAVVGGRVDFRGFAYGFENKSLENVRFLWNFGDGGTGEGQHVLHTYSFPGKYAVVVSVASGEFSATAQVMIEEMQADVALSRIFQNGETAYIVLNNLKENIDLSGWRIIADDTVFMLPERSFVVPQGKALFPAKTTGLPAAAASFSLVYPNGVTAATGADEQASAVVSLRVPIESTNLIVQTPVVKKEVLTKSVTKKKATSVKKKEVVPPESDVATRTEEVISIQEQAAMGHVGGTSSLYKWLGGLIVLIAASSGAAVYLRRREDDSITLID